MNVINEVKNGELSVNLYGATGYISRKTGDNTPNYFLYNIHTDVTQLANENGTVVKNYDYDAWGTPTKDEGAVIDNPIRYAGEYYDDESGMIYLRARYYQPEVGRFISEDPAKDGINWYGYANNNPVLFVDPTGLEGVMVYYAVRRNGGTVEYDAERNQAVVNWYGKVVRYDLTNENVMNGRLVLDSSVLVSDFNLSTDEYIVHKSGQGFETEEDAALAWALTYSQQSMNEGKEYTSAIYKDGDTYYFTEAEKGERDRVTKPIAPPRMTEVAIIHTHPNVYGFKVETFSPDDKKMARGLSRSYLVTPAGWLKVYDTNYDREYTLTHYR